MRTGKRTAFYAGKPTSRRISSIISPGKSITQVPVRCQCGEANRRRRNRARHGSIGSCSRSDRLFLAGEYAYPAFGAPCRFQSRAGPISSFSQRFAGEGQEPPPFRRPANTPYVSVKVALLKRRPARRTFGIRQVEALFFHAGNLPKTLLLKYHGETSAATIKSAGQNCSLIDLRCKQPRPEINPHAEILKRACPLLASVAQSPV